MSQPQEKYPDTNEDSIEALLARVIKSAHQEVRGYAEQEACLEPVINLAVKAHEGITGPTASPWCFIRRMLWLLRY